MVSSRGRKSFKGEELERGGKGRRSGDPRPARTRLSGGCGGAGPAPGACACPCVCVCDTGAFDGLSPRSSGAGDPPSHPRRHKALPPRPALPKRRCAPLSPPAPRLQRTPHLILGFFTLKAQPPVVGGSPAGRWERQPPAAARRRRRSPAEAPPAASRGPFAKLKYLSPSCNNFHTF